MKNPFQNSTSGDVAELQRKTYEAFGTLSDVAVGTTVYNVQLTTAALEVPVSHGLKGVPKMVILGAPIGAAYAYQTRAADARKVYLAASAPCEVSIAVVPG